MYFSRVLLDVSKRKTQTALVSPNKLHGAVEAAFAEKQDRNLWRVDVLRGDTYLLILSSDKPDLSGIAAQFGFAGDRGESKEYEGLLKRVQKGSEWRFRLAANPVHSVVCGEKRGKVTAHASEKYQRKWLEEQSVKRGFRVLPDDVTVMSSDWRIFTKGNSGHKVRILEVVFEGKLRVENADVFRDTLVNGIGREKAYGMGLLTIAGTGV